MSTVKRYEKDPTRWHAVVRKTGFNFKSKVFDKKSDAERWVTELESKMNARTHRDVGKEAKGMRVADLLERYRAEELSKFKASYSDGYALGRLLKEDFARRRLDQISAADIRAWRDARLKTVKAATVVREKGLLARIFEHAIKEWGAPLAHNPAQETKNPKGADRKRDKRWTDKDIQKILTAAEWKEDVKPKNGKTAFGWCFAIAIETAMRPSELAAVTVADFHPAERCLRLHDSKNGDARDVPLSKKALTWLEFITAERKLKERIFYVPWQSMSIYFRNARAKTDLKDQDLRFRDTRHEAATRLAKKFNSPLQLSKVTGHRSLQSLARYYNPTALELAEKMD